MQLSEASAINRWNCELILPEVITEAYYLRGTPVLDSAKQTLSIPDIQYSLEGEDLALKIGRSLFQK